MRHFSIDNLPWIFVVLTAIGFNAAVCANDREERRLENEFRDRVLPFLKTHCLDCHGTETQEAKLDLSSYQSSKSVAENHLTWAIVLDRVEAGEMPPGDAEPQPTDQQRKQVTKWIRDVRQFEAEKNAGDPGVVLARRLNNAEYNYTIRDLTGVDIRPTRSFPVDPANKAGFDNTGESLTMSPALLQKYLQAARFVAEHMVLKADGIEFASHPVMTNTDRDKWGVKRIVRFYQQQPTDLAEYLVAAKVLENSEAQLNELADERSISPRYLRTIRKFMTDGENDVGVIADVRQKWRDIPDEPGDAQRSEAKSLAEFIRRTRKKLIPNVKQHTITGLHIGAQPLVLSRNRQYARNRTRFDPEALPDGEDREKLEAAYERFSAVFPDAFYVSERGRDYIEAAKKQMGEKGRLLSAGFHSMFGYFRDDGPLYDLILDDAGREELDSLWRDLQLVASTPHRQYTSFLWFERTDSRFTRDPEFDYARAENRDALTSTMVKRLARDYSAKAIRDGASTDIVESIKVYFKEIDQQMRRVERWRTEAESNHLKDVIEFGQRATRRELTSAEREDIASFYRSQREAGLTHEEAIRDTLVSILVSPEFSYRVDLIGGGDHRKPLTSSELASRLSYFLWSTMPDDGLLRLAKSGKLVDRSSLVSQTRRMLRDSRVRDFATEFLGNWLDFRRFEEHNAVDRERFPQFTDELRQSMFEEPIRYFVQMVQHDRSVIDLINGRDVVVDQQLQKHYEIASAGDSVSGWRRIADASRNGRGGLLTMSVFLTKNAPGLRTSPVKRGYWVVRRLLGERIPPPPPDVPELPDDEGKLGELTLREALAKHRDHASCAGCHQRFDSIGLAFEGYGPVGERRGKDLGGRPVSTTGTYPGGHEGTGVADLKRYLVEHRLEEYLDNLCRKLLSYALGRSLILSDDLLVREMRKTLEANEFRFSSLIETIVLSEQFLKKRG